MTTKGRVLLADDEETFLCATADLLRQQGFECDGAPDAAAARTLLERDRYDVLVADIKMPGNAELELVRAVPEGLPVILVTGYPSVRSAIQSIQLRVVSYLVKPFDMAELVDRIQACVTYRRTYRAVTTTLDRVKTWQQDIETTRDLLEAPGACATHVPIGTFVELSLRNVMGALADMKDLTEALAFEEKKEDACRLLGCPRAEILSGALKEAIDVLARTRTAFKSKELGDLRHKLEDLLNGSAAQGHG